MSAKPLVSIVIPTRNRKELLRRGLEALAAQTFSGFEVLVVDDFSSDGTPQFLGEFARENPQLNLRWFRNEPQAGANPSRNRAIRASEGQFVAFLDDDCIAYPDWLENLMSRFASDKVAAVTGRVDDPEPTNIYELAFKGTHRVDGRTNAVRLIAGNMCVRRELLMRHMLDEDRANVDADTSVSGRGDEDGLFLMLKAAGYKQLVAEDAGVLHEHYYSRQSFFRQAYKGGKATARLGYKYYLRPRIELLTLLFAYLLLPLGLINPWLLLVPALSGSLFLAAIEYNELFRKRKSIIEVTMTFPVLLGFFNCRLAGYIVQHFRILTGKERIERVRLMNNGSSD